MDSGKNSFRVLVADDQLTILDALKMLLRSEGFEVDVARSPQIVLESIAVREYHVLLLDLNYARDTTSGTEGLQLLDRIREMVAQVPIIVMTAWGTIDLAVEALHRGARDFIQKPWDDDHLVVKLRTHAELHQSFRY